MLALAGLLVLAACSGSLQTVTGVVVKIDQVSLTRVDDFVLRADDGRVLTFQAGPIAFDQTSFPPQHLNEHMATALPVRVTYRTDGNQLVATKLEDAPAR